MPELIDREVTKLLLDTAIKQFGENWLQDKLTKNGLLIAKQIISKQPTIEAEPVRKPKMSEADRKKCEEWCKDCEHIEMCAWYPFGGCDFRLLPKSEQEVSEDATERTD